MRDIMNKISKLMEETSYQEIDNDGTIFYKNKKGEYHRENGPSIIYPNGEKHWHLNGKMIGFDVADYGDDDIDILTLSLDKLEKYKIIIIQICIAMVFNVTRKVGFKSVAKDFTKIYDKIKWDELKIIIDYCLYASKN